MAKKTKIKAPKSKAKKKKFNKKVETVMHEYKKGELNIGKSDKKVINEKQAVAIALSEAKKKVSPKKKRKKKKRSEKNI